MTDPTFKDRAGLERWGFHWQGHDHGTHVQMGDGFWTPWHVADAEIARLRAENKNQGRIILAVNGQLEESWNDVTRVRVENEALQRECNHWCSLANARQLRIAELLGDTK